MGAREVVSLRPAAVLFAVAALSAGACFGPKGDNGLRAEEQMRGAGGGLSIKGAAGDQVLARIYQIHKREQSGASMLDIVVSLNDGSRSTLVISPWPLAEITCAPAECGIEVERMQYPDGPESRVKISRKGRLVAMAATQSRLRALPGAAAFSVVAPSAPKVPGRRVSVDLRVGEVAAPRGKTIHIAMEKQSCDFHLLDATIAADPRPGIAEESPAFTANWLVVCK
jgi:hypothetical protein